MQYEMMIGTAIELYSISSGGSKLKVHLSDKVKSELSVEDSLN